MFCRNCGENIPVDSVFCPNCGKNLLEIGAPMRMAAEEPIPEAPPAEEATPLLSRLSRRRTAEKEVLAPEAGDATIEDMDDDLQDDHRDHWNSVWQNLSLGRLLWAVGLLFGVVGFIVGLAGHTAPAMIWLIFALLLVVAAFKAPEPAGAEPVETTDEVSEQEMRD